jgi:diguanylate cyclase (GGDEF)-like protein/PAS domain S-box-containing protein
MRKGRFSALNDRRTDTGDRLSAAALLAFDFRPAREESDAEVALERTRPLGMAAPFMTAAHLICGAALVFGLGRFAASPLFIAALASVFLLDFAFWRLPQVLNKGKGLRPHRHFQLAGVYAFLAPIPWAVMAAATKGLPGVDPLFVDAALIAGTACGIAALFTVPGLLLANLAGALAVTGLVIPSDKVLVVFAAIAAALFMLGAFRARDAIVSTYRRLAEDWQAEKAMHFLAHFEQTGSGWFWETNADGAIVYVSTQLSTHVGYRVEDLVGRRFEELVHSHQADSSGNGERGLGFHLASRFPFSDLVVTAGENDEVSWSLSGAPHFDHYGRFIGFRGIAANLTEQRRSEAEITKLAKYDSLTGLPNRAMMRVTLDEALANAARRMQGCALLLIDLDRFKQVNDTLGHPVGDVLLKEVAERLRGAIGDHGQIGRLGGDEFEAILPGIDQQASLAGLCERLIRDVSKPYMIQGHRISIGASVGIAIATPGKAAAEGLVKDADLALYAAKAAGRGTFRFFAPEMYAEAAERQILEADLSVALQRGELELLYQPIVDSVTEEVVAFEAQLLWAHPERGAIAPETFLPIAEESGLVAGIGEWALRSACAEAAKWPAHVRVAVNLSPSQFADAGLPAILTSALAASGVDPDRLELEISEAVFDGRAETIAETFALLKKLGVRLVLDGFGTGGASLGHLHMAPLDKIKIDSVFVRDAAVANHRNAAIVRAIVTLAESLDMDTTAEGAEAADEIAFIRQLGCSQVQGGLFGAPVPAGEAAARAAQSKGGRDHSPDFSRPPRHRIIRTGTLEWDGSPIPVRLRNISVGGAMVECPKAIDTGQPVRLDLGEGGLLSAQVRWSKDGQLGIAFDRAFDLETLAQPQQRREGAKKPAFLHAGQGANALEPTARKSVRR